MNDFIKRLLLLIILIPVFGFSQYTNMPDENFEQALIDLGYDDVIDGYVLQSGIKNCKELDVSSKGILDLTGIEGFNALTKLNCSRNQLTSLDLWIGGDYLQ